MRVGHTFTRHFDLETRQHELFGMDLGEGPSRRVLVTGAALYTVWVGGLLLILGVPTQLLFTFYFAPPALITYYGAQRSRRNERRWNLTRWALVIRYLTVGHRPIVNGGRRAADRSEWLPLRARLGERSETFLDLPGMGVFEGALGGEEPKPTAGRPAKLDSRPRLYGPDYVYRARMRTRSGRRAEAPPAGADAKKGTR
ncbi:hypothetical protein [Streptomyces albireticuli]|uniref:Uncharacterized protein n=1 Tax=Streptomyces albireticuli TaxID=1940 RepID=A0A2A2D666_9ACTN|nr:hypothetical protein [Streptomyces albireticuli]MCD9143893.1 hypothetical protein [Streptomyces albireticuli]MCD9161676.1 hypothetical protein [Streptomyces albireticuli]MCD9192010.1 hypothetical protein [Streptomyces albireticuli]PAU47015.1 hypothetical protein CK936_21030 [Streptomyces albireticuli]